MRLARSVEIKAPMEEVWDYLADPDNYLKFMVGLTRWDVIGEQRNDCGARYKMLLKVGAAEIGGVIEVVEWKPPTDAAMTSVTGADQRARWRLRPGGGGRTKVELRWAYGVAGGGIGGLIAERLAAPQLRRDLKASLTMLKRAIEEQRFEASHTGSAARAG
jgi:carbon monoxide dehydrogenase subunit G